MNDVGLELPELMNQLAVGKKIPDWIDRSYEIRNQLEKPFNTLNR